MEAAPGGGGGPAPFLLKTYEMVDDPASDPIVSWSPTTPTSFIVWDPPDFAARLLPTYFKHNNFSSFIRQLNTYGFRKIDPERWEFANEDFLKGHKHLLKNIHRRKPIHSHSLPPSSAAALSDADRAALEDEIDRLTREKAALQSDLWRFKQHQSGTRIQIDDLERRLADMEQRQLKILAFLQHPKFVHSLIRLVGAAAAAGEGESEVLRRKRRLPAELDYAPDGAALFNRDFCDKLRLELCPAMSGNNLVSPSAQSSNEGSGGLCQPECLAILPEALEISDTGASRKSLAFPRALQEGDGLLPCHLNLTLASCPMQVDASHLLDQGDEVVTGGSDEVLGRGNAEGDSGAVNVQSGVDKQAPAAPQGRVNDVFWEQFLTERPGSSDAEEASSSLRVQPVEEQAEEKNLGDGNARRNIKDFEQLTL